MMFTEQSYFHYSSFNADMNSILTSAAAPKSGSLITNINLEIIKIQGKLHGILNAFNFGSNGMRQTIPEEIAIYSHSKQVVFKIRSI